MSKPGKRRTALDVIPDVGFDRSMHNAAVTDQKRDGKINSPVVAFRVHPQDFEDFDVQLEEIAHVLDCQLCTGLDGSTTAQ